jgi:alpha-tubulin suppressor-like RCC1 family protein
MNRRVLRTVATRVTLVTLVVGSIIVATGPSASAAVAASVSLGYDSSCAVTAAGGVRCWGMNDYGQLGNGTTTASSYPVPVTGLSSGVASVTVGTQFACAMTTDGGVRCWGKGYAVGDGSGTNATTPVTPTGLASGVRSVSTGSSHVCALINDGTVKCWGSNGQGMLGDGTRTRSLVPQTVPGLSGIVQLSTGGVHTCVVTSDRGVKCWGYDAYGQVGNGSAAPTPGGDVLTPTDVPGVSNVAVLSTGGYHTCVMLQDGTAECWGQNTDGQLGDGSGVNQLTPVPVAAAPGAFAQLIAGSYDTCGITPSGATMCWGDGGLGQIGDGASVDRFVPTAVSGASAGTAAVGIGRFGICRVDSAGVLTCWGGNLWGQTGLQTSSTAIPTPKPVPWFLAGFTSSCSGLQCTYSDRSSDPDGDIATRTWVFGDSAGLEGNAATASHTYAAGGTYLVGLFDRSTVLAQSSATMNITLTPWNLLATVTKIRNVNTVTLTWNAAATSLSTIDVQMNGGFLARTSNTGSFSVTAMKGTVAYRVCPTGDARCSNQVTVKT